MTEKLSHFFHGVGGIQANGVGSDLIGELLGYRTSPYDDLDLILEPRFLHRGNDLPHDLKGQSQQGGHPQDIGFGLLDCSYEILHDDNGAKPRLEKSNRSVEAKNSHEDCHPQ